MVGKYVDLDRLLQEPERGARPRRHRQRVPRRARRTSTPRRSSRRGSPRASSTADGILVPMGFGPRGTEGKIAAVRYARENKVPFFGICFGMQMAVIEFARHVCGLERANSTRGRSEDAASRHRPDDRSSAGSRRRAARCGSAPIRACSPTARWRAEALQPKSKISERHRHRYEFNNAYREQLEGAGLVLLRALAGRRAGRDGRAQPTIRGSSRTQFHPEFKSRPMDCHPLFRGFIRAALQQQGAQRRDSAAAGRAQGGEAVVAGGPRASGRSRSAAGAPLALIAGPCVIESRDAALRHAERLGAMAARRRAAARLQVVLRQGEPDVARGRSAASAWTRACASSPRCGARSGLPVLTDVHEASRSRPSRPSSTSCRRRRSSAGRPTSSSRSRRRASRST